MQIRSGIEISDEDAEEYDRLISIAEYSDNQQYVYKIKLNSFYGALANKHFKFGDKELGESTTAGGRHIVMHQHRKVNELLNGEYDEFGEGIIYGDSVGGDTLIQTDSGFIKIADLFTTVDYVKNNKEYHNLTGINALTYDASVGKNQYKNVPYVVRHAVNKRMFRINVSDGGYVDVTEDHSVMGIDSASGKFIEVKPEEMQHVLRINDVSNSFDVVPSFNIEEINVPDYVYDIEVDTTHTFYGNGILLHNTDSTYFHTYTNTTGDAREIGDAIAEGVNKSFIPWAQKVFLIDPARAALINCGREIVADRGIFVMKKKYMLHLTDLDGYDVDKLKVMGLDTKRTTIPKQISIKLETFIERLLKGETWDDIEDDIVAYKDELLASEDILSIGIPSGINNLERYTEEYEQYEKTRLPGHVAAAILYNKTRIENEDFSSPEITSGMKIKRFYLRKQFGRFKAIALPTDMTKHEIPEWFFEFEIDAKLHVNKLVDGPINNVVKAIGEEAPSHSSVKFKSLFEF